MVFQSLPVAFFIFTLSCFPARAGAFEFRELFHRLQRCFNRRLISKLTLMFPFRVQNAKHNDTVAFDAIESL